MYHELVGLCYTCKCRLELTLVESLVQFVLFWFLQLHCGLSSTA